MFLLSLGNLRDGDPSIVLENYTRAKNLFAEFNFAKYYLSSARRSNIYVCLSFVNNGINVYSATAETLSSHNNQRFEVYTKSDAQRDSF